ncbi:ketopantoate reductase family protein [Pedobacter sp. UBA5917]|jgi:2-dehydropantoate 2-reductase|uniref:ketopantoate reductase family protein n=1 Tax=Pedobacter sp. UBA5917 TaxID=1947061 RepID=UPI0025F6AEDA|nr:2-dehydropantoate 2-reductase [Pedobacter sp. UBA5917]
MGTEKHIYIIGYGVIAKGLAVALSLNGKNVTIIRGSVDGGDDEQENINVSSGELNVNATITISTFANHTTLDGLILLANKSFGNEKLAERLVRYGKDLPVVFLQNGLGIEDAFIGQGFTQLHRCVLMTTSQALENKKDVRLKVVGPSPVGVVKGSNEELNQIIGQINTGLFPFRTEENIQPFVWKKVITNCVFNSICPLLEIDNGVFHRNETALALGKKVITECIAVANANGIALTVDELVQNVFNISKASDGQTISTYQDILNKRETEIETLNFAVAKLGGLCGQNLPITLMLGEITKLKSELFRE